MAEPIKSLKRADGTAVTAQEAYDAFINTRVLLVQSTSTYEAISIVWYDNNSAQTDPTNVGYVKLCCLDLSSGTLTPHRIVVGDSSLVPASGG